MNGHARDDGVGGARRLDAAYSKLEKAPPAGRRGEAFSKGA